MYPAKGPDSEQFKLIVDEHQTALLQLCYLYLRDVHLAEDAVQETFLKAVRRWDSFRAESSLKTWLTRIAINTCCNMRRTFWYRRVDRYITPEDLPVAAQEPKEEERELTLAVMNLPVKLREVILLYYYQDMSVQEIADILGVRQPGVSNRLRRAREKLKDYLKGEESP